MIGRRHALPSRTDYEALRRALAAAGLDPDRLNYDDVEAWWRAGKRVPDIVAIMRCHQLQA